MHTCTASLSGGGDPRGKYEEAAAVDNNNKHKLICLPSANGPLPTLVVDGVQELMVVVSQYSVLWIETMSFPNPFNIKVHNL